jgi:hypothetical protein
MRYGDDTTSIQELIDMSLDPEVGYDPWWNVYCEEGVSGCD